MHPNPSKKKESSPHKKVTRLDMDCSNYKFYSGSEDEVNVIELAELTSMNKREANH